MKKEIQEYIKETERDYDFPGQAECSCENECLREGEEICTECKQELTSLQDFCIDVEEEFYNCFLLFEAKGEEYIIKPFLCDTDLIITISNNFMNFLCNEFHDFRYYEKKSEGKRFILTEYTNFINKINFDLI